MKPMDNYTLFPLTITPDPAGREYLKPLLPTRPTPVLLKGRPGSWDEFGVRDPALLVDSKGFLVKEHSAIVMYYTGSHNQGRWQASGRAVSFDDGLSWERSPESPVLQPEPSSWDSGIATTPWVLKDDDGFYKMYYRGGKKIYRDSVGMAVSEDGIHFKRLQNNPILTPEHFRDLPEGANLMGVINVVKTFEGKYVLTFEGYSKTYNLRTGLCQIFGAISDDAIHFTPLNDGYPIYNHTMVKSWPVIDVANPRIMALEKYGVYMLSFNGACKHRYFSLGLAFSEDFLHWTEHPCNPILIPSGYPVDDPMSGRLEGGVFIKEDFLNKEDGIRYYFMAIPRKGPSHKNAVNAIAYMKKTTRHIPNFKQVASVPSDISVTTDGEEDIVLITHSGKSVYPPQAHFIFPPQIDVRKVKLDVYIEKNAKCSVLHVNDQLSTFDVFDGIKLKIEKQQLYIAGVGLSHPKAKKVYKILYKKIPEYFVYKNSSLGWKKLCSFPHHHWHTIEIVRRERSVRILLNQETVFHFDYLSENHKFRVLTVTEILDTIKIKNLYYG